VRFFYVNRLDWYLTVEPGRDVIEQPISGELDVNGWDLRKALKLLRASNPVLLEWLRSPIQYLHDDRLAPRLRQLAEQHLPFERACYHYVSMAKARRARAGKAFTRSSSPSWKQRKPTRPRRHASKAPPISTSFFATR
jgi:predicted nucleotidyltransferase